jgi:hypothetical protein
LFSKQEKRAKVTCRARSDFSEEEEEERERKGVTNSSLIGLLLVGGGCKKGYSDIDN